MECKGVLYDTTGSPESIHIIVPFDDNDITVSSDVLKSLGAFQQRINEAITKKIVDCEKPINEQSGDPN